MTDPAGTFSRAADFVRRHARPIDQRSFERGFAGGSPGAVVEALWAYRNDDGGFGHAMEPDLRAPTSQPLFVDTALGILIASSADAPDLVDGVCAFLARCSRPDGAIPYVLPDALDFPRADHWNGDFALAPSILATAGVAGRLHALGARHEWLDRAATWCFEQIAGRPTVGAHGMLNILTFLRHAPARRLADPLWSQMTAELLAGDYLLTDVPIRTYGLTPLRFAPTPDHPVRALFDDALIERHLDELVAQQQPDGGWPIFWEPPQGSATFEWRGHVTLEALRTLDAYGRLARPAR